MLYCNCFRVTRVCLCWKYIRQQQDIDRRTAVYLSSSRRHRQNIKKSPFLDTQENLIIPIAANVYFLKQTAIAGNSNVNCNPIIQMMWEVCLQRTCWWWGSSSLLSVFTTFYMHGIIAITKNMCLLKGGSVWGVSLLIKYLWKDFCIPSMSITIITKTQDIGSVDCLIRGPRDGN